MILTSVLMTGRNVISHEKGRSEARRPPVRSKVGFVSSETENFQGLSSSSFQVSDSLNGE